MTATRPGRTSSRRSTSRGGSRTPSGWPGPPWALRDRGSSRGTVDELVRRLAEEALRSPGRRRQRSAGRLLGRLAMEFIFAGEPEAGRRSAKQAVDVARRREGSGDAGCTLYDRSMSLDAENIEERLAVATEMLKLAEGAGRRRGPSLGHYFAPRRPGGAGDMAGGDRRDRSLRPVWQEESAAAAPGLD